MNENFLDLNSYFFESDEKNRKIVSLHLIEELDKLNIEYDKNKFMTIFNAKMCHISMKLNQKLNNKNDIIPKINSIVVSNQIFNSSSNYFNDIDLNIIFNIIKNAIDEYAIKSIALYDVTLRYSTNNIKIS